MTRPSGVFKQDRSARLAWGEAYDAIPKSVFALAAWHLANMASSEPDVAGAAETRMIAELEALRHCHLPQAQADRAIKAIRSLHPSDPATTSQEQAAPSASEQSERDHG